MWTYSGDPSSDDKDAVRFEIQDIDEAAPLLQDEEINFALSSEGGDDPEPRPAVDIFRAAARCCEVLARRFAAQTDTVVGSLTETYSHMAETYAERASELRAKASGMSGPYLGGQSWGERWSRRMDADRVQPRFSRGEFSNRMARGSTVFPDGSSIVE